MHLFRGLNEEQLAFAAGCFETRKVGAEDMLFEQGEEAGAFYIVTGGRLKVTRKVKGGQEEEMLGVLDEGDFLGLDVFQENCPYQVTAQAVTEVGLLVLDIPHARELFDELPNLAPRFRMMIESHNLQMKVPLNWVSPEEYVHFISGNHVVFLWAKLLPWLGLALLMLIPILSLINIPYMTVFVLLFGLVFLAAVLMMVWHYVDWANDYHVITGRRVIFQEKVVLLYESRQESPLEQIQSISVETTQLGRILNYGNLVIRTFSGTMIFRGVHRPQDIMALIQEMQKRTQSSLRQAELRQIEETLKQRIGLVPPKPPAPPKPAGPKLNPRTVKIQKFMADLFHLRYEIGDTIQYRTHWWILVKNIWFQTLVVLAITGLQIWLLLESALGKMNGFPVLAMGLGLCLVWLVAFLFWLYQYIDWHNDIYLITSDQVVDINRKPLGNEQKKVAQTKNILSVEYKRIGVLGLLLNFGTVFIRVGETVFTFDDVYNPSEVQRELFHRLSQRNLKERQAQGEAERQRMAEWIAAYHRITHR